MSPWIEERAENAPRPFVLIVPHEGGGRIWMAFHERQSAEKAIRELERVGWFDRPIRENWRTLAALAD